MRLHPCHFLTSIGTHQLRSEYLPELERAQAARQANLAALKVDAMDRMMEDLAVDKAANPAAFANDRWDPEEQEEEDVDGEDNDLIDRSMNFTFIVTTFSIETQ